MKLRGLRLNHALISPTLYRTHFIQTLGSFHFDFWQFFTSDSCPHRFIQAKEGILCET
jgi:hypothetical protein